MGMGTAVGLDSSFQSDLSRLFIYIFGVGDGLGSRKCACLRKEEPRVMMKQKLEV